jgi:hypothetical protein
VEGDVEGEPESGLIDPQEVLPEEQVPGARNRQELGQPLHYAQQDGI